jgi:phosphoadenosine phosphosulfate reductase
MAAKPRLRDGEADALARAAVLDAAYGDLPAESIVELAVREEFVGGIALGADSAVLLDIVARVDRNVPVLFLETGKHFGETLAYRDALVVDFGLSDLRVLTPDEATLERIDPNGRLHETDTNACCDVRKVEPLARGIAPFQAWFTGRKRHQASTRSALPVFEAVGSRIRVNPLARWTTADQADYMRSHDLRENPLVAYGYLSIGCFPCTQPVQPGEDARSGRWVGQPKTECGIHLTGLNASLTDASL